MLEIIGIIAAICFALSALPQAIKAIKEGHSKGLSLITLLLWLFGEILMIIYTIFMYPNDYILFFNYLANIILLAIIFRYKVFPRK